MKTPTTCERCGATGRLFTFRRLKIKAICASCGRAALAEHPATPADRQRAKRNRARRERQAAMLDLGLVRVRGALGGVYYE